MKQEYRFFIKGDIAQKPYLSLEDDKLYHQLSRVLRLSVGDEVILLDNSGYEYIARICQLTKHVIDFSIVNKKLSETEPLILIHLYQALLKKKEKFEWVLQKGTELGVSHFVPVITVYGEFRGEIDQTRSQTILKEAAEQSHRGKIPCLEQPLPLETALVNAKGVKFLCDPSGEDYTPVLSKCSTEQDINIFVGPEGGFSDSELALAQQSQVHIIRVGNRIMRSETAGIFVAGLLLHLSEKKIHF